MTGSLSDLELVRIDVECSFVFDAAGRIVRTNAPDAERGPRLSLVGCAEGNVLSLGHEVGEETARAIEALAADEPPLGTFDAVPLHRAEYLELLARESPVDESVTGPRWLLPGDLVAEHDAHLVRSGTPEGDRLVARLAAEGMTPALLEAGFLDTDEFWAPWCAAVDGDEVASICFAARLGSRGAEAGVFTMPAYRGRGLAAAVTAGWANHVDLRDHVLFYSTSHDNRSSQRVAARLGLRFTGTSLRVM